MTVTYYTWPLTFLAVCMHINNRLRGYTGFMGPNQSDLETNDTSDSLRYILESY